MLRLVTDIHVIQSAHNVRANMTDAMLECNGRNYFLVGTATGVADVSIASVDLLTTDSTPQRQVIATDAVDGFVQAARNLINNGTPFYTCLRGSWNLPAYKWEMNQ